MKKLLVGAAALALLAACGDEPEVVVVSPAAEGDGPTAVQGDGIDPREDVDAVILPDGTTETISNRGSSPTGATAGDAGR